MLVLRKARLVYLANPKTASQAIRAMLGPHAERPQAARDAPHMNARTFARRWSARLEAELGGPVETVAVMREPVAHMDSWFRYRQRDAIKGQPNSTAGLTFAEFVEARLSDDPPPFAALGRQDRFLGFIDGGPPVTHVFDYADIGRMVDFLSDRLDAPLSLGERNISPRAERMPDLPEGLAARFRRAHRTEIALYELVAEKGHLVSR